MTTTEFESWINQGLGRAVTRLRAEKDKSPFYSVVLRVAQRQPGFTHCTEYYINDLIHCFNDTAVLEEAAEKSLCAYRDMLSNLQDDNSKILQPDYSFEKLYELVSSGEIITTNYYEHTNELTEEQRIKLAQLANSMSDLKRKRDVLSIFQCNDVPWPLEPEPLVRMAREYLYSYGKDKPKCEEKLLTSTLISVLRNVRSDCVRELGFELLERGFIGKGISLWAKNYRPDDRERFVKLFKEIKFGNYNFPICRYEVLDLIRSGGLTEPEELLMFMYDNSYHRNFRYILMYEIKARGLLTKEINEECKHDNWYEIRELALWHEKYIKSID
jgi:hypothetical protein